MYALGKSSQHEPLALPDLRDLVAYHASCLFFTTELRAA